MKIPEKLKIKTRTYDVVYDEYLMRDNQKYGMCEHNKQKITLDSTQKKDQLEKTFFHEILHVALDSSGLRLLNHDLKERIVSSLGEDVLLIIKENNLDLR